MQIPSKIQHGEKVIATVFDKINGIIDYLNASRIRKGPGILVDESPSGTVIKLEDNRPATPPQVLPAGSGGASGIEAAVSGGTASITLTGGTGSVKMVGSGSVSISGNTNGEVVLTGSGGSAVGFPNYFNPVVDRGDVDLSGTTYSYNYPVWLIGNVGASSDENDQVRFDLDLWLGSSNQERVGISQTSNDYTFMGTITNFVCIPIPANTPFYFVTVDDLSLYLNELTIYPCL